MAIKEKQLKILWGRCGNKCALCFGNVTDNLGENIYVIGENAHIEGENPTSARHSVEMDNEAKNAYSNLIVLCPTCHTIIDKEENRSVYTKELLKKIKYEHEQKIFRLIQSGILDTTFAELEVVLNFISNGEYPDGLINYSFITPSDKIQKNFLSPQVEKLIKLGMTQTNLIEEYIRRNFDVQFGNRLRSEFVIKYKQSKTCFEGDALFYDLLDYASGKNRSNFAYRSAGLAVLVYFFNKCDIFEK